MALAFIAEATDGVNRAMDTSDNPAAHLLCFG